MLTQTTVTGAEPVTLAEAKLAARVDGTELDAYITGAIEAARRQAEQITGRLYRGQTLREQLQDWPAGGVITLPVLNPATCAITYWTGSAWVSLIATAYAFGPSADLGGTRTDLAPVTTWPTLGALAAGPRVRIDLTVPAPTAVPEAVKLYIKASVSAWVNNGDGLVSGQLAANPMLTPLLDAERLWC